MTLRSLQSLYRAMLTFAEQDLEPATALTRALDPLIEVTGADAGAVGVRSSAGLVRLVAERRLGGAAPVSRSALAETFEAEGERPSVAEPSSASAVQADISSILCAPVRRQGRTMAAVYLDRRGTRPAFEDEAVALLECFATALALAVDLGGRLQQAEAQREEAERAAGEAKGWAQHARDFRQLGRISTRSDRFAECLASAGRAARFQVDLLIQGETGTGKEFLARCIHEESKRRGPFVALNCTALPEGLADNELFGHEPGAFTGAARLYRGCFEQAEGGTLFLDEIGDLPGALQPKLLRALEEHAIRRVGGDRELPVDVRILAATNRDLAEEVRAGRFREDLYYRLQVLQLKIPPLRERLEDLPELATGLLRSLAEELGRTDLSGWDPEALRVLARYPWPGNVRELKNLIKKLCVLCEGPNIGVADLARQMPQPDVLSRPSPALGQPSFFSRLASTLPPPDVLVRSVPASGLAAATPAVGLPSGKTLRALVREAEKSLIEAAIAQDGSIAAAARRFRIRRQTLHDKCKRLGIRPLQSD